MSLYRKSSVSNSTSHPDSAQVSDLPLEYACCLPISKLLYSSPTLDKHTIHDWLLHIFFLVKTQWILSCDCLSWATPRRQHLTALVSIFWVLYCLPLFLPLKTYDINILFRTKYSTYSQAMSSQPLVSVSTDTFLINSVIIIWKHTCKCYWNSILNTMTWNQVRCLSTGNE